MKYIFELKKLRKKIITKTVVLYMVLIIMFFLPMIISNEELILSDYLQFIIICGFIVFICGKYLSKSLFNSDIEKYKKIFAKNVTLEILQNIFKEVKYNPTDELPPKDFAEIIDNAKIPTSNSYSSDDYISAKYKNIVVEYSDIRMGYTPRNSDSNYHENFKGKWLVINFEKKFKSNIQIGPRIYNGKKINQMLKGKNYKEIQTNDIDFNKKFVIYTDNEKEFYNILTHDKIEKTKKLYKETKGKIFLFFLDNKIHVGIGDKKNFFEPNIYKSFNLESEKRKILDQINIIIELIDYWI